MSNENKKLTPEEVNKIIEAALESDKEPARITPARMERFTWQVGDLVPVERKKKVRKLNVPMTNIAGCLFGIAFGDVLAADTEFLFEKGLVLSSLAIYLCYGSHFPFVCSSRRLIYGGICHSFVQ